MSDEVCWLIASPERERMYPLYLGVTGSYLAELSAQSSGHFYWAALSIHALRFARETDAVAFVAGIRHASENLPHRNTIEWLRSWDEFPRIVEHSWTALHQEEATGNEPL